MLETILEGVELQKFQRIAQNTGRPINEVVKEALHDWLECQEGQSEYQQSSNSSFETWGEQAMKEIEQLNMSHETGKHILKAIKEFRGDEGV